MEISCILAALFFLTANVVKIVFFAQERRRNHWDMDEYTLLSLDYLKNEWDFRLSAQGLWFASSSLNAFAWIMFAYPVVQMAWLLSNGGTKAITFNIGIVLLAFGGAFTEWMSNLFWIGMNVATKKIVEEFNLDQWVRDEMAPVNEGLGWKSVEINHIAGSGFIWFVDTFEWMCLAGIFVFTYLSVRIWRKDDETSFGERWNILSLVIGLLCVLEFLLEIARFEGFYSLSTSTLILSAINRLIFIPVWIISLGFMMPRAILKQAYTDTDPIAAELALAELSSLVPGDDGGKFSIDDTDDVPSPPSPASPPPEAFASPLVPL
jgi:hypothetical protein